MPISITQLDSLTAKAISLLEALIAIPAYSKEEDERASLLVDYFNSLGIECFRIANNVILGSNPQTSKPIILLNSHIDTVRPSSTWQRSAHIPTSEGDRIYGLGTNDAGASLVCLIMTYLHLHTTDQPYHLVLAASAEEEISGQNGIVQVINHLAKVDLAIVGEPTGMQMAIAEKGLMVVDAIAEGISGHAAREEGKNAIYQALEDITWIRQYSFDKISPYLGLTKATVTMIQSGTQHNVIPDQCTYVIDVRSNELYSNKEILDLLQSGVQSILKARSFRLNSSTIDAHHPIVIKGTFLGLSAYGSPTLSDQALMPYTSIKIGPGDSARSHTADEFITREEIRLGIKTYIDLLDGLILN
ncbi:MAG: M20/M25/M40 family metallo-hydrolase [Saprospiraceae bacterium]|jgi:acetylornithine deacetylase|nr:M20/M25/M40 family metallo-hydrolase [Saprospiraceae bacterium]MBP7922074.1 M20/M25/M40 family metallo-hydrolase [Saprospiraceae bacterium]MBP8095021.1 M20/M25/M40 family metallo-hydrolase [Saprospiraceae bacterium]MBP8941770.1 M20/M25/M40 family metallo-hydrolase [Saprospiraceae bacterium]MBP9745068.1 M20/M25/M40 family metallo-hydrolase [Saprospiraceae bacterium]